MKKVAWSRGFRKAIRTVIHMAAGGALTALVDLVVHGLAPAQAAAIMIVWSALVTFLHNFYETEGVIPALLPTPGLLTTDKSDAVVTKVIGTVDTVTGPAMKTGTKVLGDVITSAGGVVGTVTGTTKGVLKGVEDLGGV